MAENEILADKTCIPCQGGVPRLDIDEANEITEAINRDITGVEVEEEEGFSSYVLGAFLVSCSA